MWGGDGRGQRDGATIISSPIPPALYRHLPTPIPTSFPLFLSLLCSVRLPETAGHRSRFGLDSIAELV